MDTITKTYDRAAEDLGNIVGLEHVNLLVPDQRPATLFYVSGLGLTRDPYMMTSVDNMWINVGPKSQFHLPTGKDQRLRGRTAMVIPGREQLLRPLTRHLRLRHPLQPTDSSPRKTHRYRRGRNASPFFSPDPRGKGAE